MVGGAFEILHFVLDILKTLIKVLLKLGKKILKTLKKEGKIVPLPDPNISNSKLERNSKVIRVEVIKESSY